MKGVSKIFSTTMIHWYKVNFESGPPKSSISLTDSDQMGCQMDFVAHYKLPNMEVYVQDVYFKTFFFFVFGNLYIIRG